jgi:2,4-dienoyl-CoA reductase-like NADH-dependent reductase (Old Yellow Enzyme family)
MTGLQLFTPLTLGEDLTLKNRIVLAPMGRARADLVTRVASENNAIYYEQRAGAGLLLTDATSVSEQAHGWYGAPALYTQEHADGWKKVTERVHAKNGKIFVQLWHMGRMGHSSFNAKHELISASAIPLPGGSGLADFIEGDDVPVSGFTKNVKGEAVPYETPRALTTEEVAGVVDDFRKSAELAKAAGFDGVEIHGGNSYLVDQFLQSSSNKRTDKYGGSFENRARFLLEIIDALKTVWPAHRIGLRIAPNSGYGGMGCPDNAEFFTYLLETLSQIDLSYVSILDGFGFGFHDQCRLLTASDAKKHFKGLVLANNSYSRDTAEDVIRSGAADFVSFGRSFISNPDLAERFENDWPLAPEPPYEHYWDTTLGGAGYIDYPVYSPSAKQEEAP